MPPNLQVIDSNKLNQPFSIVGIYIEVIFWGIMQSFNDVGALIIYLNTTFVDFTELTGEFQYEQGFITYTNPEKFENSEIMAILGQTLLVYRIGAGGAPLASGKLYIDTLPDGSDFIDGLQLQGKEILAMWENETPIQLTTDNYDQSILDSSITFTSLKYNCNLWILVADLIPGGIETGFPYNFQNGGFVLA